MAWSLMVSGTDPRIQLIFKRKLYFMSFETPAPATPLVFKPREKLKISGGERSSEHRRSRFFVLIIALLVFCLDWVACGELTASRQSGFELMLGKLSVKSPLFPSTPDEVLVFLKGLKIPGAHFVSAAFALLVVAVGVNFFKQAGNWVALLTFLAAGLIIVQLKVGIPLREQTSLANNAPIDRPTFKPDHGPKFPESYLRKDRIIRELVSTRKYYRVDAWFGFYLELLVLIWALSCSFRLARK